MKGLYVTSLLLTSLVLGNAYHQKKHFYPMMVYITRSNPSLAVLFLQVIVLFTLAGRVLGRVFFGEVTHYEVEALMEKSWYIFTDSCFAFTTFRTDYSPHFPFLLCLFFFFKTAHILTEERITLVERTPVIPLIYHVRMVTLIFLLCMFDLIFINSAVNTVLANGISWHVAFALEYSILFILILNIAIKYLLNCSEMNRFFSRESKAMLLLYVDVVLGVFKTGLYTCFGMLFILINQMAPLFLIRPLYGAYEGISRSVKAITLSRRAVRVMHRLFPDATPEDFDRFDRLCIICREDLDAAETSKRLPCNHIFHVSCLRLWFHTQQNCPTCRLNVLEPQPQPSSPVPPPPAEPPANQLSANLQNTLLDLENLIDIELHPEERSSRDLLIEKLKLLKTVQRIVDSSVSILSMCCAVLEEETHNENSSVTNVNLPNSSGITSDDNSYQEESVSTTADNSSRNS